MESIKQGIIYGIKEISNDKIIYIGSTTLELKTRVSCHKTYCYSNYKSYPVYQYIRNIAPSKKDFDKYFVFETLQNVVFNDKKELLKLEEQYIKKIPDLLNTNKAFRTKDETLEYNRNYCIEHREQRNEYHNKYSKSEKQREYHRQYMREYNRRKKNNLTV